MQYLIFDFDGVIGDTRQASAEATAKVNGVDVATALRTNLEYASKKPNHTRDHTLSEAELHSIYEWTVRFGEHMKESNFALFEAFVAEIVALSTPYKAIVSSGSQRYVIPAVEQTLINPTHILAYEDHHSKEEKIELICTDWGVTQSEVFYFTDTLADVYELQGFIHPSRLIGVGWGYCGKAALQMVLEDAYILDEPSDIHRVL